MTVGAAVSLPAAPKAARADWAKTLAVTAEGGYRVGNPAAPVKLVEYASLTCDHCAKFAAEGVPALLAGPIKSGRVSFEFRNFVRDPVDLAAALLSRCAAPERFFALTHRYFASQQDWNARYAAATEAQRNAVDALPQAKKLAGFASLGGLDSMAVQAGVTPQKAAACLADTAAVSRLAEMRKVAVEQHKVQGTPSFLVNGRLVEAHDWQALQPLLGPPGG